MNFDHRFPEANDTQQIITYLREIKNILNGLDAHIKKLIKAELDEYINAQSADALTLDDADEGITLDDMPEEPTPEEPTEEEGETNA